MNGRILFITHQLSRTGAPIVLLDMIKLCKREGADIDVITMMDGELGAVSYTHLTLPTNSLV